MTITEFLLARIAEDEAVARAATEGPWEADAMDAGHSRFEMNVWITAGDAGDTVCDMGGLQRSHNEKVALDDGYKDAQHIARHDPARVLAECAAKRAIIAEHQQDHLGAVCTRCRFIGGYMEYPCPTLEALAAVYADHPDYRQEWAPNGN